MYKIKNRFSYVNMTKEIEETIANDAKQMEELYDKIEILEGIIKEKDIEISMLNDKIKILTGIIDDFENTKNKGSNNLNQDTKLENNNIKIDGSNNLNQNLKSETLNNDKDLNFTISNIEDEKFNGSNNLNHIKKDNINIIPTPSTSNDSKINHNNIKNIKNKIIKILIINYYKHKYEKIIKLRNEKCNSVDTSTPKKIQKSRNKSLPILERFGTKHIKNEDIKDSEILRFVGEEDCFNIEYQYLVANKIDKKQENISIDDVVEFKIKYENKRNTKSRRKEYRYLIKRCSYLFNKYDKNLGKFKISLSSLRIMSEDEWNQWKIAFDNLYKEVFKDSIKCDVILKYGRNKGKPCNRLNCKIKHKDDI